MIEKENTQILQLGCHHFGWIQGQISSWWNPIPSMGK